MNRFFSASCLTIILLSSARIAYSADADLAGFSLEQLDTAITKNGLATQTIYSILTFDSEERQGANLAILSGTASGWRVTVLRRVTGGLTVEWSSGQLPGDTAVSSAHNFKIGYLDDGEQVVEFSGCAPHLCGGLDGASGFLLYSSRSRQVFFAHYAFDEKKPLGSFGLLRFSNNAEAPGNERYKLALRKVVSKELGQ